MTWISVREQRGCGTLQQSTAGYLVHHNATQYTSAARKRARETSHFQTRFLICWDVIIIRQKQRMGKKSKTASIQNNRAALVVRQ